MMICKHILANACFQVNFEYSEIKNQRKFMNGKTFFEGRAIESEYKRKWHLISYVFFPKIPGRHSVDTMKFA